MHSRRRRRSTGIDRSYQLDCTQKCQLPLHASLVLSCVSLGNLELIKHCSTVCANCWGVRDCFGRTALHVAASCGHLHVVDWLVAKRKVRLDEKDGESKWTALHRSTYFGRAGVCVYLSKVSKFVTNTPTHPHTLTTCLLLIRVAPQINFCKILETCRWSAIMYMYL